MPTLVMIDRIGLFIRYSGRTANEAFRCAHSVEFRGYAFCRSNKDWINGSETKNPRIENDIQKCQNISMILIQSIIQLRNCEMSNNAHSCDVISACIYR